MLKSGNSSVISNNWVTPRDNRIEIDEEDREQNREINRLAEL